MGCTTFLYTALVLLTILSTETGVGARNDPIIFTKDGSVHIRSGDDGNIVFEHPSPQGKVIVAGQELNVINSTGPKGEKGERGPPGTNGSLVIKGHTGDKGEAGRKGDTGERGEEGLPGTNGTIGPPGVKGARGQNGPQGPTGIQGPIGTTGRNGSDGRKGDPGAVGPPGPEGAPGAIGPKGMPGRNGTVGEKGANGTQGPPGVKGEKGDMGDTWYFRGNESEVIQCNSSNLGVLRYSSRKLQLCTPHGWRYLSFEPPAVCNDVTNVPKTNYETFRNADLGIMFQFNRQFVPRVISQANLNVTTDISPVNSTLSYQDAVMRQGVLFLGKTHLRIFGISDDFWRKSNWSVMALLKFRDIGQVNIMVLGHGSASNNEGLHLGIRGKDKTIIHGYYSNDLTYAVVKEDTWYHITWTSEKDLKGTEKRCIAVNGNQHFCNDNNRPYQGSGVTTVGTWWHEKLDDNLLLDNLIITNGIVRYKTETSGEKQVCFAKTLDENIP